MKSLKLQLLLLVLGPLLILGISMTIIIGVDSNNRARSAAIEKAKGDLATTEAIINLKYPGSWEVRNGVLFKGQVKMSENLEIVDYLAKLTGDTVTIFLGDKRVATTVRKENGERAIGTKVSENVAVTVLRYGQVYTGEANVIGQKYQTAYKPIVDQQQNIIGMLYVGINKKLAQKMIQQSLSTIIATGAILTIIVGLIAWFITQRKIIGPLQQITRGTQKIATRGLFDKIEVNEQNEIGELARSFNQMVEGLEKLMERIDSTAGKDIGRGRVNQKDIDQAASFIANESEVDLGLDGLDPELPKGISESTLKQIVSFMRSKDTPMSAEEVGEYLKLTRVTARRYLEFLEQAGLVEVELKYGTVGRPVKLYKSI